ncbi:DUF4365 domain-containing protein [Streptomyces malaysiensis]|uniref:DUF4365 domain-containing protein n=1 Tax=Streptomyces malaysiensis TaxID=92644 RepID=UPI00202E293E|nr:DUF4365 domain-containing protein [Streptomyces malaysiensis]
MTIVPPTHLVDRAGVSRAAYLVSTQLGWLFREQETSDIGIDAHLEVVDDASLIPEGAGRGTGRLLAAQIKSGNSQFTSPADGGWWFYCDAKHIEYWVHHSLPVIVMLFNPTSEKIYWQHVNDSTLVPAGRNCKIFIPLVQELTRSCSDALSEPARRRADSGSLHERPTREFSVRQADHELANAIDLLATGMGKSLAEAEPRDFRLAFASQLRALHRLVGTPKVEVLSAKTGYEESKLIDYMSGKTLPGRVRVVTIIQALFECAHERGFKVPDHLLDVRAWERMWRVADRPGMQKIVKNKARKGS